MNKTVKSNDEYPALRRVTRRDRKKLSELIELFVERSGSSHLVEMVPGQGDEKDKLEGEEYNTKVYDLIKSIMSGLLKFVESELSEWFMDLIGCKDREAYDNMPFDIEVYIIDQLIAQKGFNNFFSRASALYKKIRG